MVLVGPSGCGKSTLLRLIAGLETLTGGNIWVGDRQVNHLPPKERDIAMVFQSYALYPHMTVYDNLAFGLRRARGNVSASLGQRVLAQASHTLPRRWRYETEDERSIAQRVQAIAEMLQIETLLDRLPKQLSGGTKAAGGARSGNGA
ncbi:MAG: ABC transporter ATP-binding protein [Leptolyngbyaceae cyanobacterium CSU_1_4]|nr:ABC transporter ATP-binding protein [Leptolyngbyaceae cyanobacterium CSU_1_4]